jgi:hypothetical protein
MFTLVQIDCWLPMIKNNYKIWGFFSLHVKIMDILHNDERSRFLKRKVQLNIKLEISPNILNLTLKNLTLNLYTLHMFIMNLPAMAFREFFKTHTHLCKGIACV